jgi:hypothetical protein
MKCPKCNCSVYKNDYDYLFYCKVCNEEFSEEEVTE